MHTNETITVNLRNWPIVATTHPNGMNLPNGVDWGQFAQERAIEAFRKEAANGATDAYAHGLLTVADLAERLQIVLNTTFTFHYHNCRELGI